MVTVYDGLTVQLVGELFTGDPLTMHLHAPSRLTYLKALSNLAFGLVLSDQIVLAPKYPAYANSADAPGYDLHSFFLDQYADLMARKDPPLKIRAPFAKPGESVPHEVVQAVHRSLRQERSQWRDYVTREVVTYFPDSEHYQDCDINLTDHDIEAFFGDIATAYSIPVADFQRFVRRCLGAHILGDYKVSTFDWGIPGRVIRSPHFTRAHVHLLQLNDGRGKFVDRIQSYLAPQLLSYAHRSVQSAAEFFEDLIALRENDLFKELRHRLGAGIEQFEEKHSNAELQDLSQSVESMGKNDNVRPVDGQYVSPGMLANPELLSRIFGYPWAHDVEEKVIQVFPTLRERATTNVNFMDQRKTVLNFQHAQIAMANFGIQLGQIESTLTILSQRQPESEKFADAMKELTNGVVNYAELADKQKREILEALDFVAKQAAEAPDKRQVGVLRPVLDSIQKILTSGSALVSLWHTFGPTITKFFAF